MSKRMSEILTAEQVAEIAGRAEAAYPAPWEEEWNTLGQPFLRSGVLEVAYLSRWFHPDQTKANLDFVAASRTDVPALCASHEALRREVERQAKALELLQAAVCHYAQSSQWTTDPATGKDTLYVGDPENPPLGGSGVAESADFKAMEILEAAREVEA